MKVLIVDDEAPARERLQQLLEELDGFTLAGMAGNGKDALGKAAELQPDIVLLDIRMPGMNGIETAHHMNRLPDPPAIVFATAYDEYAMDAFDARAIGYVLKPVRVARLKIALEQASKLRASAFADLANASGVSPKRNHVCATTREKITLVAISEINFFHADQKYVAVHHNDGVSLIDDSLKALEQEFTDEFVRIHRSALVAVDKIECLQKTPDGALSVVLRDGSHREDKELIISRRHVAEVRRRLKGG
ncbi:MAG TPA: LytTR family DNA-binding domain-containing protein [Woeseiaceae bacterium]|nr:LytTR family DNA-binding domain-containing protein [Woeseiaceae bacterium]